LRIQSVSRSCPILAVELSPSRLLNAPLVRPREQQQHLERKFSAQQAASEGIIGWCADSYKKREKEWDGEGRWGWWSTGSGDKECVEDVVSIQSTAIQRSSCECGRYFNQINWNITTSYEYMYYLQIEVDVSFINC
jgi:hypothetical protein